MLKQIRAFFEQGLQAAAAPDPAAQQQRLHLACAALMIELTVADNTMAPEEKHLLRNILRERFALDDDELEEFWRLAQSEARDATSLYQFTTLINDGYEHAAKVELIEHLWRVAYADGRIDPYEEHLIRKLADLLYLSHADFIRAKLKVGAREGDQSSS